MTTVVAPNVTICIPAWQAEPFIDRTLGCARNQTHAAVRILVSVDACGDRTGEICREHAHRDERVEVIAQSERLGWSRNANFLLDQVDTDFFFLYFHDDVVLPQYTERLLQHLSTRPEAASAHCDMGHFGGGHHLSVGRSYEGSAAQRLATFLVAPARGSPLRSLTRTAALGDRRLPTNAVAGFWANEPYLMRLLASGPALHVPETLYLRWDKRAGGLTDSWTGLSLEQIYAGYRSNVETALGIIDEAVASECERAVLRFCLYVQVMFGVRSRERERGARELRKAGDVHAAFAQVAAPASFAGFGSEIETWTLQGYDRLCRLEQRHLLDSRLRS